MVRMTVSQLGVDRQTNTPVVILKEHGGDRTLPIWIGTAEANAIATELRGERPARPMTHDLFKQVLVGLGGELRRVTITALRERTYLAELLVYRGDQIIELDARPSDSIAIALRLEAPIFAAEELLDQQGQTDPGSGDQPPSDPEVLKRYLSKLDPQDLGRFQL
jgi:bifunctional DNase/RNase